MSPPARKKAARPGSARSTRGPGRGETEQQHPGDG
uniref:Uncharacterized protein n=1 Tax=Arundo donax TaxID=35708 RepID=A0A0A9CHN8_ARUDO